MKTLIALFSLAFTSFALANPSNHCPQQSQAFEALQRNYNSCLYGGNNCDSFCSQSSPLLGGSSTGNVGCTNSDLENARNQGRQEVLRDLSVTQTLVSANFYGINADDCKQRLLTNVQPLIIDAQNRCNNQARTIRNCRVVGEPRVIGSFGRPAKIEGRGNVELRASSSSEASCRDAAVQRAQADALANCQRAVGSTCTISNDRPVVSYRVDRNPFGGDKRKCGATVTADASADITYTCKAEITARNQASSF